MRLRPLPVLTLSAAAATALLLLHRFEYNLIFWPSRTLVGTPTDRGLPFEEIRLSPVPGIQIHGWHIPHPSPSAVILYLQGNGGNRSQRLNQLSFIHELGCAGVIVDYEGYNGSDGKPTEAAVYRDAAAVVGWIRARAETARLPLIVWGESLGGAVGTWLASRFQPDGLIVDHSFTTMGEMVDRVCRGVPLRHVCRSRFPSIENIRRYHGPILVLHGEEDRLIPVDHGRRLFEAANEPRRFVSLPGVPHHHDEVLRLGGETYRNAIADFLQQALDVHRTSKPRQSQPEHRAHERSLSGEGALSPACTETPESEES